MTTNQQEDVHMNDDAAKANESRAHAARMGLDNEHSHHPERLREQLRTWAKLPEGGYAMGPHAPHADALSVDQPYDRKNYWEMGGDAYAHQLRQVTRLLQLRLLRYVVILEYADSGAEEIDVDATSEVAAKAYGEAIGNMDYEPGFTAHVEGPKFGLYM
jgi:hypothetical protein